MSPRRQAVDLGSRNNPRSPRFRIALIRSEAVRTSIEGYLTARGVEIGRLDPPGWFQWLDEERAVFQARCGEPPGGRDPDDGYQPFNYYIQAEIIKPRIGKIRAIGVDFYHERILSLTGK